MACRARILREKPSRYFFLYLNHYTNDKDNPGCKGCSVTLDGSLWQSLNFSKDPFCFLVKVKFSPSPFLHISLMSLSTFVPRLLSFCVDRYCHSIDLQVLSCVLHVLLQHKHIPQHLPQVQRFFNKKAKASHFCDAICAYS